MTIEKKQKVSASAKALVMLAAASAALALAPASFARELNPEFSSRVWIESENEIAGVSMNGKDLITFRSRVGSGTAAEEADDLAANLQDLITDKNFDPSLLLPAKEGDKAAIRIGASTVCTFVPGQVKEKGDTLSCFESSLQVVNGLRVALGASGLPARMPDFTDRDAIASGAQAFSGQASWYGPKFHGRKTSDGSRYDMEKMTAAHRSLPFGTQLLVMNRKTGAACVVQVNDRGPFIGGRVLDLSKAAARKLNMLGSGVAMVDCLVIGQHN